MMSHNRAPEQLESQITDQANAKQPSFFFMTTETVACHEESNAHQDIGNVERQRIVQQMKYKSARYTDRNDDGIDRPMYEVSGYDTHEKQRKYKPCGHIYRNISVNAECLERIYQSSFHREYPIDGFNGKPHGISYQTPFQKRYY